MMYRDLFWFLNGDLKQSWDARMKGLFHWADGVTEASLLKMIPFDRRLYYRAR